MDLKELVQLVQNVGFPIGVSIYLLVRLEKKLDELTSSIRILEKTISKKL